MVGVVERHHRGAAGVDAGYLHRVLHRLSTGIEQRGALLEGPRGEPVEMFRHRDVLLVRGDHEAGVGEVGDLLADGLDHARRRVADGGHGDTGAEVDEPVAVDVLKNPAGRAGGEHRHGDPHGVRDRGGAAFGQLD